MLWKGKHEFWVESSHLGYSIPGLFPALRASTSEAACQVPFKGFRAYQPHHTMKYDKGGTKHVTPPHSIY